jgi:hypothetical protein
MRFSNVFLSAGDMVLMLALAVTIAFQHSDPGCAVPVYLQLRFYLGLSVRIFFYGLSASDPIHSLFTTRRRFFNMGDCQL